MKARETEEGEGDEGICGWSDLRFSMLRGARVEMRNGGGFREMEEDW